MNTVDTRDKGSMHADYFFEKLRSYIAETGSKWPFLWVFSL